LIGFRHSQHRSVEASFLYLLGGAGVADRESVSSLELPRERLMLNLTECANRSFKGFLNLGRAGQFHAQSHQLPEIAALQWEG